jgi:hypothetical protein
MGLLRILSMLLDRLLPGPDDKVNVFHSGLRAHNSPARPRHVAKPLATYRSQDIDHCTAEVIGGQ